MAKYRDKPRRMRRKADAPQKDGTVHEVAGQTPGITTFFDTIFRFFKYLVREYVAIVMMAIILLRPLVSGKTFPSSNLVITAITGLMAFVWLLDRHFLKGEVKTAAPRIRGIMTGFTALCAISLVYSFNKGATFAGLLDVATYILIANLVINALDYRRHKTMLLTALIIAGTVVAAYGIFQYYSSFPTLRRYIIEDRDAVMQTLGPAFFNPGVVARMMSNRVFSTLIHAPALGGFLCLVIAVMMGAFTAARNRSLGVERVSWTILAIIVHSYVVILALVAAAWLVPSVLLCGWIFLALVYYKSRAREALIVNLHILVWIIAYAYKDSSPFNFRYGALAFCYCAIATVLLAVIYLWPLLPRFKTFFWKSSARIVLGVLLILLVVVIIAYFAKTLTPFSFCCGALATVLLPVIYLRPHVPKLKPFCWKDSVQFVLDVLLILHSLVKAFFWKNSVRIVLGALLILHSFVLVLTFSRGAWVSMIAAIAVWLFFALIWRKKTVSWWEPFLPVLIISCGLALGVGVWNTSESEEALAKLEEYRADVEAERQAAQTVVQGRPLSEEEMAHIPRSGFAPTRAQMLSGATLGERRSYWTGAWNAIKARPVLGSGFNTFSTSYLRYMELGGASVQLAHNDYLQIWSELGTLGLVLFVFILGGFVLIGLRSFRLSCISERWETLGLTCAVVVYCTHALVDFDFYVPAIALFLFVIGGLIV
ncbi:O-antigen ligase family protein, partial [Candidatus Hydrogenedentota bacterium]